MKRLVTIAVFGLALALFPAAAGAQEPFPAPGVTVIVSELAPGAHPDQQTIIDMPTGAGFDSLRVTAPPGGSVASDADIPDGTAVGRLDATATTNAGVAPECNIPVTFTVPIREETTDITSPEYPPYLRTLAPGEHRLRLVADVSPSPAAEILINYLFDIDPITTSPVLQVFVGDPDNPPPGFVACTPQTSRNTLFGLTPDGTPLITSADPLPDQPQPFLFEFTSRPDADGERNTQTVEVTAEVGSIELERVGLPTEPVGGPDIGPGLLPPSPAEPPQVAGIGAPSTGTGPSAGKATWPVAVAIAGALIAGLGWAVASRKGH